MPLIHLLRVPLGLSTSHFALVKKEIIQLSRKEEAICCSLITWPSVRFSLISGRYINQAYRLFHNHLKYAFTH